MTRVQRDAIETPHDEAISQIYGHIEEIAWWLKENPNAHKDVRRSKLRAWKALEQEVERHRKQIARAWDAWIASDRA